MENNMENNMENKEKLEEFNQVLSLAEFLEKTRSRLNFEHNKVNTFTEEEMKVWKGFYNTLIVPGILKDGKAFGAENNLTPLGIGCDGQWYMDEFYQLLSQCYRYLFETVRNSCNSGSTSWKEIDPKKLASDVFLQIFGNKK